MKHDETVRELQKRVLHARIAKNAIFGTQPEGFEPSGPWDGTEFTSTNSSGNEVHVTQVIERGALVQIIRFSELGTGQQRI